MDAAGKKRPLTSNRNNDRWPWMMQSGYISFSAWSRNQEVITADFTDIRPVSELASTGSRPTDRWMAAFVELNDPRFGGLVKTAEPVWRVRPLYNGRFVFMTAGDGSATPAPDDGGQQFRVVQAAPNTITSAPSAAVGALPLQRRGLLFPGPERDAEGRRLSLGTPSPCPPNFVLLSGAPLDDGEESPKPGRYGLYLASDAWGPDIGAAPTAATADLRVLFDDPDLVDAEPVAVCPRRLEKLAPPGHSAAPPDELELADGSKYRGPMGQIHASAFEQSLTDQRPGQVTDTGAAPIFGPQPTNQIDQLRIFASRRDRFDDPMKPRIEGNWELVQRVPVRGDAAKTWLPSRDPTVLAGFDRSGKVVRWTVPAADSRGHQATFAAFAGDHYSGVRPGIYHFCNGCHVGHSMLENANHTERQP
jgi:hypothetical protein